MRSSFLKFCFSYLKSFDSFISGHVSVCVVHFTLYYISYTVRSQISVTFLKRIAVGKYIGINYGISAFFIIKPPYHNLFYIRALKKREFNLFRKYIFAVLCYYWASPRSSAERSRRCAPTRAPGSGFKINAYENRYPQKS